MANKGRERLSPGKRTLSLALEMVPEEESQSLGRRPPEHVCCSTEWVRQARAVQGREG